MRSLRVLYVTSRHDAPYRYRCLIPALHLRAEGIGADILHVRDSRLPDCVVHYSVVVLFRLPWSARVERIADAARAAGARLVFDIDDLVFDPDAVRTLPFFASAPAITRAQYIAASKRMFATFQACDAFIGATPALQRHAAALDKPSYAYPNLLHPRLVEIGRRVRGLRDYLQRYPIIAYFRGSATHDADFAMIAPVLDRILAADPRVRLLVCGFLEVDGPLVKRGGQLIRIPFVDWRVQPWLIGLARVNLAPISRIDAFAHAKSALKFFEAGAVGVPTVASPTESFVATIQTGRNGFIAADADAWRSAIVALLDPAAARRIGDAGRETAIEKHSIAGHRHALRELLRSMNGRIKRPSAVTIPLPSETPDLPRAPSRRREWLSAIAQRRAVIGILRRARRPEQLGAAGPESPGRFAGAPTRIDGEIARPTNESSDRTAAVMEALLHANELYGVYGDEAEWRRWGVSGKHLFIGERPGAWRTAGYDATAMLSEPVTQDLSSSGQALVSMAVKTDEDQAFARIGWQGKSVGGTPVAAFYDFPLITSGAMHHYLVEIGSESVNRALASRVISFLPVSVPGEYRIDRIMFVAGRVTEPGA